MLGNFSIGDYFKQARRRVRLGAVARRLRLRARGHLDHGLRGRRGARPRPRRGGDRGLGVGRRPARAHRPAAALGELLAGRADRPVRARAASSTSTAASTFGTADDLPGGENERFLEYWNLVFMQYDSGRRGRHHAHAAAGAEHRHRPRPRTAWRSSSRASSRSSRPTTFAPLMALGRELASAEPDERALRILADHSRAHDVPHRRRRRALQRGPRLRPAPRHAPRDPAGPPDRHRARLPAAVRRAGHRDRWAPPTRSCTASASRSCSWARAEEESFGRTLEQGTSSLEEVIERSTAAPGRSRPRTPSACTTPSASRSSSRASSPPSSGLAVDTAGFEVLMERAARRRAARARRRRAGRRPARARPRAGADLRHADGLHGLRGARAAHDGRGSIDAAVAS